MKHLHLFTLFALIILAACKQEEDPIIPTQYSITVRVADAGLIGIEHEFILLKNGQVIGTGKGDTITFSKLEEGQDYTVIPKPQAPSKNGLSTLDLVKIEDFINQTIQLSFFEQLAADVNLDNEVTTADIDIIRQCIIADENCPGWRYATINYNGAGEGSIDSAAFPALFSNQQVTFKVFKLGDINCTVGPC